MSLRIECSITEAEKDTPPARESLRHTRSARSPTTRRQRADSAPTTRRQRADNAPTARRQRADSAPTTRRQRADNAPTARRQRADNAPTTLRTFADNAPTTLRQCFCQPTNCTYSEHAVKNRTSQWLYLGERWMVSGLAMYISSHCEPTKT